MKCFHNKKMLTLDMSKKCQQMVTQSELAIALSIVINRDDLWKHITMNNKRFMFNR